MHALKRGIPRAYRDHRTRAGRAYGAYIRAIVGRFGGIVPADVHPTLREAGRIAADLDRVNADLEDARGRRRRRDQARLRRQLVTMRSQLVTLERRLEERMRWRPARRAGPLTAEDLET